MITIILLLTTIPILTPVPIPIPIPLHLSLPSLLSSHPSYVRNQTLLQISWSLLNICHLVSLVPNLSKRKTNLVSYTQLSPVLLSVSQSH